jgi:hypothetical protein
VRLTIQGYPSMLVIPIQKAMKIMKKREASEEEDYGTAA